MGAGGTLREAETRPRSETQSGYSASGQRHLLPEPYRVPMADAAPRVSAPFHRELLLLSVAKRWDMDQVERGAGATGPGREWAQSRAKPGGGGQPECENDGGRRRKRGGWTQEGERKETSDTDRFPGPSPRRRRAPRPCVRRKRGERSCWHAG